MHLKLRGLLLIRFNLKIVLCFILFFPVLIWAQEPVKTGSVDFALEPILSHDWVCYIQGGDLYIRSSKQPPHMIRNSKEASGAILSPVMKVIGDSIYASWIEKGHENNKILFASIKTNNMSKGEIKLITNTKATGLILFPVSNDKLYIIEPAYDKNLEIFINIIDISLTMKESFNSKRIPLKIEGLDYCYRYAPLVVENTFYLFIAGAMDGKNIIGVNLSDTSFAENKGFNKLNETESVSFMEAFSVKNKPAVIYKTTKQERFVLEGLIKREAGWDAFSIKDAEGIDIARMDSYVWEDGRILIIFSGEERGKFKQRIYSATSDDEGVSWIIKRIDNKQFDNTRSWLPRLSIKDKLVAVVWEDSRDIRSAIRLNLSKDRGEMWLNKDILISDPKKISFRPKISLSKGDYYISWHQFKDDERSASDIIIKQLDLQKVAKESLKKDRGFSLKQKETFLKQRVNTYWKAMIKKNLKTTYMIHDPFFRAKIPYEYYASRRGPMIYHNYSIEGINIEENVAFVKIRVKYEVPKFTIQGKESSLPVKEAKVEDIYLFIDGKWFRKFIDVMSGGSAIDY